MARNRTMAKHERDRISLRTRDEAGQHLKRKVLGLVDVACKTTTQISASLRRHGRRGQMSRPAQS
eukprot:2408445-Pleurochrysis_carterae.AAC.1